MINFNIIFFFLILGRNKGSPIRIFTNVDQCKITLPVEENYKFCDECNRWVCSENVHCFKCNNCTSKVKIHNILLNIFWSVVNQIIKFLSSRLKNSFMHLDILLL